MVVEGMEQQPWLGRVGLQGYCGFRDLDKP